MCVRVVQFFKAVYLLQACNLRLSVYFCTSMTAGFNLALGRSLRSGCISFATWNVRTLVENTGDDRRICRARPNPKVCHLPSDGPHCVDRKLDLLVNELKKLNVAVAGIQETK